MPSDKNILRTAGAAIGPYRRSAIVLFVVLIVGAVVETMSLGMVLPLLQVLLGQGGADGGLSAILSELFNRFSQTHLLPFVCGTALLLFMLKNAIVVLRTYLSKRFLADLREYWSSRIIKKYLQARYRDVVAEQRGTLLNNVINEPNFASKCMRDTIDVTAKAFLSVSILLLLLTVNWKITLIGILCGGFLAALQWRATHKYSYAIGKKKIQLNQNLSALAAESLTGFRQVKIFSMEADVVRIFKNKIKNLVDLTVRIGVVAELPKAVAEILIIGVMLGGILMYAYIMKADVIGIIPTVGIFVVASQRLFVNLSTLLAQRISIISYLPSLVLVHETLEKQFPSELETGRKKIEALTGDIGFDQVSFGYTPDKMICEALDLRIPKNKITAIAGPSGAGKSTVCDLLSGFFQPSSGVVSIAGCPLPDIDLMSWRRLVGYVSQENFLFNMSIRDNIRAGSADAGQTEIESAARQAEAHEFIMTLPQKYDTSTGEAGTLLSGGQLQRIALARALVRNPEVLIFDEATSALDRRNEDAILQLVSALKNEKTILIITHRLSALRIADYIYVMDAGRVVEKGSYFSLLDQKGLFWQLSRVQNRPVSTQP